MAQVMTRRQPHSRLPSPGPRLKPVAPPGTATCPRCDRRFVGERYERALRVCPNCGFHASLPAPVRAQQLADPGSLQILEFHLAERDPLAFDDGLPYPQRLKAAKEKTGLAE